MNWGMLFVWIGGLLLGASIGMKDCKAQQSTYTDKTGAVVGYSYKSGNQTTYVDKTGKTYGYEYRAGNQSTYVSPTGSYEGSRTRSWDTTDRYGVDPAKRGSKWEDD